MTYILLHTHTYRFINIYQKDTYNSYNHVCKVLLFEEPSRFSGLPCLLQGMPVGLLTLLFRWIGGHLGPQGHLHSLICLISGTTVPIYIFVVTFFFVKLQVGMWKTTLKIFSDTSLWVLLDMDMYKLIWDFVNLISRPFMDVYPQRNPHFLCWQDNSSANKLHPFLTAHRGDHESLP